MRVSLQKDSWDDESLLELFFDLTRTEKAILGSVDRRSKKSANDLADELGKDVTTIQRNLKSLKDKELVTREKQSINGGGYHYTYQKASKETLQTKMLLTLEEFQENVLKKIKRI